MRFFGKFLANPGSVGSVIPSSRYLASAIVAGLQLQPGDLVLEYGPGTGPMTAALQEVLPGDARYLGIEIDGHFLSLLQQHFPGMDFHHGLVQEVEEILKARDLSAPRAVISGLPFAAMPVRLQAKILATTSRVLVPDGEFRTFQYVHAYRLPAAQRFRQLALRNFAEFSVSQPVLRNVPPALVLTYRQPLREERPKEQAG